MLKYGDVKEMPSIYVTIVENSNDVLIRVSDQGMQGPGFCVKESKYLTVLQVVVSTQRLSEIRKTCSHFHTYVTRHAWISVDLIP